MLIPSFFDVEIVFIFSITRINFQIKYIIDLYLKIMYGDCEEYDVLF